MVYSLEHVIKHAPHGWREQNELEKLEEDDESDVGCFIDNVLHFEYIVFNQ